MQHHFMQQLGRHFAKYTVVTASKDNFPFNATKVSGREFTPK